MKVLFNGKVIGEVTTNRSLTVAEALYALGYDMNDVTDCEKAYNDGFEPAYVDDNGQHCIDFESIELEY